MRINIDETAWAKFALIANGADIHPNMVAGAFAALWHASQDARAHSAKRRQVEFWLGMTDDDKTDRLIDMGIMAGFLEPSVEYEGNADDTLFIVGNRRHIEAYEQKVLAGKSSGRSRQTPQIELNDQPRTDAERPFNVRSTTVQESEEKKEPIQFNTIHKSNTYTADDLEPIYEAYPRRPNTLKGEGMKSLIRQLKHPEDFEDCLVAARAYAAYCVKNRTEKQFIKQFRTWCGSVENPRWREWLEPIPTDRVFKFTVPD